MKAAVRSLVVVAAISMCGVGAFAGNGHRNHPRIHRAIKILNRAKTVLNKAAHDYQGKRAAAVQEIDQALNDLQACLQMNNDGNHHNNNNGSQPSN